MNARILKKLCKRSTPYLKEVCTGFEFFKTRAGESESFTARKFDMKHFERWGHRSPRYIQTFHGTDCMGWWTGGEESVWECRHTFHMLSTFVFDHFTVVLNVKSEPRFSYVGPRIRCRSDVFKAAKLMVQQIKEAKK